MRANNDAMGRKGAQSLSGKIIISLAFLMKCSKIYIKLRTTTRLRQQKKNLKKIIIIKKISSILVYESNVITHNKSMKIRRERKVCTQSSAHTHILQ